jgi:hypothetical protein
LTIWTNWCGAHGAICVWWRAITNDPGEDAVKIGDGSRYVRAKRARAEIRF